MSQQDPSAVIFGLKNADRTSKHSDIKCDGGPRSDPYADICGDLLAREARSLSTEWSSIINSPRINSVLLSATIYWHFTKRNASAKYEGKGCWSLIVSAKPSIGH